MNYLQVPLKENWEQNTAKLSKWVYLLGEKAWWLVNKKFDELHCQEQMKWSTQSTSFGFPVFIIWKMIISDDLPKWKSCVVVDIQGLNQISQPDSYFLFLQTDITSAVWGCHYISMMDCASFFYQWLVNPADQHKFIIVSHCDQKHFNVAVMGYCNSPPYVQQQMNRILCFFCAFAQEYMNDIIIFSKMLNEHVHHLHQVFSLFQDLDISLEFKKFYLDYSTVTLLGQWVDVLGLFTSEKKIRALADLQFPTTLKALEIYLGLMGWLCFYILYYTQITASLQTCKTALLKASPAKKNTQKQHISHVSVNKLSPDKVHTFKMLQDLFRTSIFLIHFNSNCQLYIDMDVFKQYDFGAIIYHVEEDPEEVAEFLCHKIQFILFLSKLLTSIEWNYWSIKMETTELVWIVWKTRHLIESALSKLTTIVFTDHSTTIFIAQQTHLITTTLMNKLNLWLVWASQYLSQFNLDMQHCPGKIHLVLNALSWLLGDMMNKIKKDSTDTLDDIGFYHIILIELTDDFKWCLQDVYKKNDQ